MTIEKQAGRLAAFWVKMKNGINAWWTAAPGLIDGAPTAWLISPMAGSNAAKGMTVGTRTNAAGSGKCVAPPAPEPEAVFAGGVSRTVPAVRLNQFIPPVISK